MLTILTTLLWGVWGFESKLLVDKTSPYAGQVLFTIGILVLGACVLFSSHRFEGVQRPKGIFWAVLTGLLGGIGNVFFFFALKDGKASVIVPLSSLSPLVTVLIGVTLMREKVNRYQLMGLVLAILAIFLLSI